MAAGQCGRLWEVDAYREGRLGEKDAASFARHARGCAACGAKLAADERLGRMARELSEHEAPSALALRRLRVRVLRDVATGEGADEGGRAWLGWRSGAVVAFVAVLAVLAVAKVERSSLGRWGRGPGGAAPQAVTTAMPVATSAAGAGVATEVYAGAVAELGDARWTQSRADDVERVALAAGSVRVHVRHQRVGERFLVTMPDGEIEVRGTTFDVTVVGEATTRVHVDEGVVALRLAGRDEVLLRAGDTWTAAPASRAMTATPARAVAAPTAASAMPATTQTPAPTPADQGESAYAAAVALLRDGRDAEAAAALQAFLIAHPQAPQAEDASYLEAVALARAGRADAAALAAEQHLARFPGSFHRREAEALVERARVSGSR